MIYAGYPSCLGFGMRGQSYSNFLASTVYQLLSVFLVNPKGARTFVGAPMYSISKLPLLLPNTALPSYVGFIELQSYKKLIVYRPFLRFK